MGALEDAAANLDRAAEPARALAAFFERYRYSPQDKPAVLDPMPRRIPDAHRESVDSLVARLQERDWVHGWLLRGPDGRDYRFYTDQNDYRRTSVKNGTVKTPWGQRRQLVRAKSARNERLQKDGKPFSCFAVTIAMRHPGDGIVGDRIAWVDVYRFDGDIWADAGGGSWEGFAESAVKFLRGLGRW
jgi:hypothetical protein